MTLYEKILQIYPELTQVIAEDGKTIASEFGTTILLQNDSDGKGDYIAKWEHPTLTRPTQEQLDGVTE